MIKALVDGREVGTAKNDVKAICFLEAPRGLGAHERHITVTDEGIVVDIVVNGEVVESRSVEHHELIDWEPP